jgi:REP element-mobilizing transposase RayT
MPQSATLVYVHYIWATWDRAPLISPAWENRVYDCIREKCLELRCEVLAIGGIEDHVHVLTRLHPDIAVSRLAKTMKGSSSHLVNHEVGLPQLFRWQGGYGALSVSRTHLTKICRYIAKQKEHHKSNKLWSSLEIINIE